MQYRLSQPQRTWWFPAVALALVVALTWAPVVAAAVSAAASEQPQTTRPFTSGVTSEPVGEKFSGMDTTTARVLASPLPKRAAPPPKARPTASAVIGVSRTIERGPSRPVSLPSAGSSERGSAQGDAAASRQKQPSAGSTRTTAKTDSKPSTNKKPASSGGSSAGSKDSEESAGDKLAQAQSILASLIAQHPILAGTTVSIGATPGGYQAVAYFKSGRILISPNHKASLSTILRHEIWHIIDWRDNNRIDWGENVPPK